MTRWADFGSDNQGPNRQGCGKDAGDSEGMVGGGATQEENRKEGTSTRHYRRVLRSK